MRKSRTKEKEKLKTWADATPEEKREAWMLGALWTSDELEGRTDSGAFSEANLGENPIIHFPRKAYQTLKDPNCNWKWKEGTKLSTLFINVIKSDMAHTLRDYIENGKPDVRAASEFERDDISDDGWDDANDILDVDPEDRQNGFQVKSQMELLEELQQRESRHDRGYKIARAAAKAIGNPKLERLVELAFEPMDRRTISKKMKITKTEVIELEDELCREIKKMLKVERVEFSFE